jgi:spore maturation protein CgeB
MVKLSYQKVFNSYTYKHVIKNILDEAIKLPKRNIQSVDFEKVLKAHKNSLILILLKNILVFIGKFFYGKEKGKRFARRVVYEFSWRVFKEKTYSSKSIVGRMFYDE